MLTRLDHLVILVHDLDLASADYRRLGFEVTPGGEHAEGLTRNALVPFEDGTYFELVSFVDPEDTTDNVWGWREFLPYEGLIDYCAASNGLDSDAMRLETLGFEIDGPDNGGRRRPDGSEISWRSARIRQEGRLLPFLIEDLTPHELRVPSGPPARHPNGASGVSRIEISTPDTESAADYLSALVGPTHDAEAPARLGACGLSSVEEAGAPIQGPSAVELVCEEPGISRELDSILAPGASISLRSG